MQACGVKTVVGYWVRKATEACGWVVRVCVHIPNTESRGSEYVCENGMESHANWGGSLDHACARAKCSVRLNEV